MARASEKKQPSKNRRVSARTRETRKRERLVLARATLVLGEGRSARTWLASPNRALGGERPKRLLRSRVGTEAVLEILGRILYGVYS
jgi:putative toxin-antitoxin system antitoxin component (TIGR02293 family)